MSNVTTFKIFQVVPGVAPRDPTRFIAEGSDGKFYHGTTLSSPEMLDEMSPEQLATWLPHKSLPYYKEHFPAYDPATMTKYTGAFDAPEVFVKYSAALEKDHPIDVAPDMGESYAELMRREIAVGEALLKSPHPNLCEYRGVLVHDKLGASDIVYKRYTCDLMDFVEKRLLRSEAQVLAIETALNAGRKHLNSLGFGHNDI
jgi:hypothetical protein